MNDWVLVHESDTLEVWNRGGRWWHELPKPSRVFHRHREQTRATMMQDIYWTYRCACGATRYSDIPGWTKRER